MAAPSHDGRSTAWASASELAEYAYCPRAWYYRSHPPPGGRSREGRRAASEGEAFHGRTLAAEWERERSGTSYAYVLVAGFLLALAGVAWILS
jgi:hypothetical protein